MNESGLPARTIRTIRLDDEQLGRLLDTIDAGGGEPGERRGQGYKYRVKALLVHMQQPGSSITVPYLVSTRRLGNEEISFLHGGFVHGGTRCLTQLVTTYGAWDDVWGAVTGCRYVQANIHEVTVRFERQIDPSIYCAVAVQTRSLLVEDDPAAARLAAFHLQQLNTEVECVTNGKEAIDKAKQNAYDVIFMDMEMPVMDGFEAVRELRKCGYTGSIVAITALTQPNDQQRCLDAGCDRYLPKPYTRQDLSGLLRSIHEEPLISSFHKDPAMVEIINAYVEDLPGKVRAIEEAVIKRDLNALQTIVRVLKAEGNGYGFEVITERAAKVESALIGGAALEEVQKDVTALVRICMRARQSGGHTEAAG